MFRVSNILAIFSVLCGLEFLPDGFQSVYGTTIEDVQHSTEQTGIVEAIAPTAAASALVSTPVSAPTPPALTPEQCRVLGREVMAFLKKVELPKARHLRLKTKEHESAARKADCMEAGCCLGTIGCACGCLYGCFGVLGVPCIVFPTTAVVCGGVVASAATAGKAAADEMRRSAPPHPDPEQAAIDRGAYRDSALFRRIKREKDNLDSFDGVFARQIEFVDVGSNGEEHQITSAAQFYPGQDLDFPFHKMEKLKNIAENFVTDITSTFERICLYNNFEVVRFYADAECEIKLDGLYSLLDRSSCSDDLIDLPIASLLAVRQAKQAVQMNVGDPVAWLAGDGTRSTNNVINWKYPLLGKTSLEKQQARKLAFETRERFFHSGRDAKKMSEILDEKGEKIRVYVKRGGCFTEEGLVKNIVEFNPILKGLCRDPVKGFFK